MVDFLCVYCFQVCFCRMTLIVLLMTRGLRSVYILLLLCPFNTQKPQFLSLHKTLVTTHGSLYNKRVNSSFEYFTKVTPCFKAIQTFFRHVFKFCFLQFRSNKSLSLKTKNRSFHSTEDTFYRMVFDRNLMSEEVIIISRHMVTEL